MGVSHLPARARSSLRRHPFSQPASRYSRSHPRRRISVIRDSRARPVHSRSDPLMFVAFVLRPCALRPADAQTVS
eukprot:7439174-Pyramimonas_sp.AAC.1